MKRSRVRWRTEITCGNAPNPHWNQLGDLCKHIRGIASESPCNGSIFAKRTKKTFRYFESVQGILAEKGLCNLSPVILFHLAGVASLKERVSGQQLQRQIMRQVGF